MLLVIQAMNIFLIQFESHMRRERRPLFVLMKVVESSLKCRNWPVGSLIPFGIQDHCWPLEGKGLTQIEGCFPSLSMSEMLKFPKAKMAIEDCNLDVEETFPSAKTLEGKLPATRSMGDEAYLRLEVCPPVAGGHASVTSGWWDLKEVPTSPQLPSSG